MFPSDAFVRGEPLLLAELTPNPCQAVQTMTEISRGFVMPPNWDPASMLATVPETDQSDVQERSLSDELLYSVPDQSTMDVATAAATATGSRTSPSKSLSRCCVTCHSMFVQVQPCQVA